MTSNARGQSLELFFIDGRPDGMLTAEVFNWTGHVLMTPRTQLSAALKRREARYTGIYLLFGEDEAGPLAYIGEGEDISARIKSHDTAKDWWTSAVLITTAGNNLNKAHVKYLEARLIEEARHIGRIRLENGNTPARPSLSEAARANMENFLDYVMMVLPALRIDSFLAQTRPGSGQAATIAATSPQDNPVFELYTPKHDIRATARLENGEFVVQAGSQARHAWESKLAEHSYATLFQELVTTGVLREEGEVRVFSDNYAFRSPSAAAAVVNGRPANGTLEWKLQGSGRTYKEWEAEKLEQEGIADDQPA
ncbi:MAG: methionine sulfoxide reductase [Gammaproteobacteria bacterium]|nr:methionine sulfoxide reductase [Gammaproteobacteria bacterium]